MWLYINLQDFFSLKKITVSSHWYFFNILWIYILKHYALNVKKKYFRNVKHFCSVTVFQLSEKRLENPTGLLCMTMQLLRFKNQTPFSAGQIRASVTRFSWYFLQSTLNPCLLCRPLAVVLNKEVKCLVYLRIAIATYFFHFFCCESCHFIVL